MNKLQWVGDLGAQYFAGVWEDGTRFTVTEIAYNTRLVESATHDANVECVYPGDVESYTGPHESAGDDPQWAQVYASKMEEYSEELLAVSEWSAGEDGVSSEDDEGIDPEPNEPPVVSKGERLYTSADSWELDFSESDCAWLRELWSA